jgi:hypothetical protein
MIILEDQFDYAFVRKQNISYEHNKICTTPLYFPSVWITTMNINDIRKKTIWQNKCSCHKSSFMSALLLNEEQKQYICVLLSMIWLRFVNLWVWNFSSEFALMLSYVCFYFTFCVQYVCVCVYCISIVCFGRILRF